MAQEISIKKGLDIRLAGDASEEVIPSSAGSSYGVSPTSFPGLQPRLSVQVGDRVMAGSPVLYHKSCPEMVLVSPVSGEVVQVVRGAKRKILYVEIKADADVTYKDFDVTDVTSRSREELLSLLMQSGMLALLRKRPYDMVPDPTERPRDIYVTANFTAPLLPDTMALLGEDKKYLQIAADVLGKLTEGDVYMGYAPGESLGLKGVREYEVKGPHPAGNVGVLINHTRPINQGEVVWTLSVTEMALLGRFLTTGHVDLTKRVACAGTGMEKRGITIVRAGAKVKEIVSDKKANTAEHLRLIDGDVLTGLQVTESHPFLSTQTNIITAIPEGDETVELFGWMAPGLDKYSVSRTFTSWLTGKRKYTIDARLHGSERPLMFSNEYDKVFPMDIFPEQLIRAIITFDIERMEQLGIYEVVPEDFALCEFVDTSKLPLQAIVRDGLDQLYKEMN